MFVRRLSGLDTLLSAQKPLSAEHDEHLFIVIHQVQELWMRLFIHELDAAMAAVREDRLRPAFKALARCGRIQEQLVRAWDVLSTMTPADYLAFRERLGASSGFQSFQYRMIEFKLGAKNAKMLAPHAHAPARHAPLLAAFEAPSIYDEAIRLLARRGLPRPGISSRETSPRRTSTIRSWKRFGSRSTAAPRSCSTSTSSPRSSSTSRT